MSELLKTFESETCSRCGGTGSFSYCQSYGSTCFKCHGKKSTLTKRGAAAFALYVESLKVELGSLKIGELMLSEGVPGMTKSFFGTVFEISEPHVYGWTPPRTPESESWGITVRCKHEKHGESGYTGPATMMVRKGWTAEEKAAKRAAALAFQATLTKEGKVMKRKKVEAVT